MAVAIDSTVEMDTDLHYNAVNILLAIYDAEDETANTSEIGATTGLSSANISGNHAQTLEQRGLIERAGSIESNAPNDTNVYTLTHRGRKEAKRLLKQTDAEVPMSDGEKLALLNFLKEHREELEQLSAPTSQHSSVTDQKRDELVDQIEENSAMLENLKDRIDDFDEALDIIHDHLKTLFKKV